VRYRSSDVVERALVVLDTWGLADLTMRRLGAELGVQPSALYHHFANKQQLFEAVLDSLESQAKQRVTAATTGVDDPWESAMAGLDAFLELCCDPVYGRLVWQEGPVALGWARWKECEEEHAYGLIEGFVRALVEAGLIEVASIDLATRFCFHLLGAAGQELADADDARKQQTKAECADLTRRMLTGLAVRG